VRMQNREISLSDIHTLIYTGDLIHAQSLFATFFFRFFCYLMYHIGSCRCFLFPWVLWNLFSFLGRLRTTCILFSLASSYTFMVFHAMSARDGYRSKKNVLNYFFKFYVLLFESHFDNKKKCTASFQVEAPNKIPYCSS
jgi:hypothetical protein